MEILNSEDLDFWISQPNFENYIEVYIELKNERASYGMDLEQFLDNAKLTYISEYMVII
ncbi:MAG: hypothetical protein ACI828_000166 [Flavobacteriales bacterium]|jgi:hypothetical protein